MCLKSDHQFRHFKPDIPKVGCLYHHLALHHEEQILQSAFRKAGLCCGSAAFLWGAECNLKISTLLVSVILYL